MTFTDKNYINIPGWMITDLKLHGNELMCYAIIYGYSQGGDNSFYGKLTYLQDALNMTERGVIILLQRLVKKGFLIKSRKGVGGGVEVHYIATIPETEKSSVSKLKKVQFPNCKKFSFETEKSSVSPIIYKEDNKRLYSSEEEYACAREEDFHLQFLERFFANESGIEALLKSLNLNPDDKEWLKESAKDCIKEWELEDKRHTNYQDFARHLKSHLRIKISKEGRPAAQRPPLRDRRDRFWDDITSAAQECKINSTDAKTFFVYWAEENESGIMKFESQEFWNIKARLIQWKQRNK